MPISLSGTLTDPYGDPRGDATITFRAIVTSNSVLEHANAAAITDSSGTYAITVEFGRYNIEVKESGSPSPRIIAKNVLINGDTTAADLNELVVAANGYDDLTPQIVVEFRELRDETQGYRDEAVASAQSASEDATATAADRQAVADDRAHVDQQRQAVDTTADEVEADRLAAQQARTGAEDAQGASETARDESRSWATGDGVIDTIGGTDRYSSRVEANRAADERQGAEDAATAAADSETNAAGSAQTALEQANRAESEADRANTYADNTGYVTRQRLAEQSTLNLDFARGKYLVDDGELTETTNASEILSVERASKKWVMGPNGKLREVTPNTIARHWDPVTGEPLGALIEESRTNLLTGSESAWESWYNGGSGYFNKRVSEDSVPWMGNVDVAFFGPQADRTSYSTSVAYYNAGTLDLGEYWLTGLFKYRNPNGLVGNMTMRTLHRGVGGSSGSGGSLVARLHGDGGSRGSRSATGSGIFGETKVVECRPVGNDWYYYVERFELVESGEVQLRLFPYDGGDDITGDGETGILRTRLQLEKGYAPSSYTPTQGEPVTRDGDVVTHNLGDEYNPNGFSVYAEARQSSDTGSVVFLTSSGLPNSIRVGLPSNNDRALFVTTNGSIDSAIPLSDFTNYTPGDPAKFVLVVDPSNGVARLTINGQTKSRNVTELPTLDEISIGNVSPTNNNINGTVHDCIIYPTVITASEAEVLTS